MSSTQMLLHRKSICAKGSRASGGKANASSTEWTQLMTSTCRIGEPCAIKGVHAPLLTKTGAEW
jgi:hypothetical protein